MRPEMARLVAVSGEQTVLEPNRSYVFGRGPECDFVLADIAASRQHARLTVGRVPKAVFLQDLGSRNGTYVNDEAVEGRKPLLDQSRLRIGTTLFLFTFEVPEAGAWQETGTIPLDTLRDHTLDPRLRPLLDRVRRSGTGFAGQLAWLNIIEVLQLLMHAHKSGTIHVETESGSGRIEIRLGEVYAAIYRETIGKGALKALARESAGLFWLEEGGTFCDRQIETDSSRLLVELCQALEA